MNLCQDLYEKFRGKLVIKHNCCGLYSEDEKRRYYYSKNFSQIIAGKKVTVIMINPSEANSQQKIETPDNTIGNICEILKFHNNKTNDKISSFEVINLFSTLASKPEDIINSDNIEEINEKILKYVISKAEIIIPAWGAENKFKKNAKELLLKIKQDCKNKKVMVVINKYPCHFSLHCTSVGRNPEFIDYKFD